MISLCYYHYDKIDITNMEVLHSRLLKFFTKGRQNKPEMAEAPVIKIQKYYQSPENVEAEVPGTHKIREYDGKSISENSDENNSSDINTSEIKITGAEFTLSPVITVTKTESTLTKGEMKLQKVTVTEDISVEESENAEHSISREVESLTQTEIQPGSVTVLRSERREKGKMEGEEKSQDDKKSKIPMLRLRQAVEKVKRERQAKKAREQPRRSSIPQLKDPKKAVKRDTSLKIEPKVEEQFDKLYEEIIDNKQKDIDDKLLAVQIEDPVKVETKFEEIIHAYDEDEHEKHTVSRISKIPALKRKDDDGHSRITALINRAKVKSTGAESKLKDGGFNVTASSIRTKRFSRGNSSDLNKEEQQIEVTETIDIKESGDNNVFIKEPVKTPPVKPERTSRNIAKRIIADDLKADTIETIENNDRQNIATENLDKKDGTLHKTKRFTRVISREIKERRQNRDLIRKAEDNRKKSFDNEIEDSVATEEFKDGGSHIFTTENTVRENIQTTPVKTESIVRNISREINKEGESVRNTETVATEELKDGGTRTITTKTTESMKVGTPVITEKIIRNISREISNEGPNDRNTGVKTIEGPTGRGSKNITKENIKSTPVKTERFTRGISREMGNIRSNKETVKVVEAVNPGDNKGIRKETMKSEQIEKEGVKVGIPVFTKVTRSFSKGKVQNVEMSRTIEWKPADVVKTKTYSRSVSEKVTKKELKDTGKWKFEAPTDISVVTVVSDKPIVETDSKSHITPKDHVLESKIKDTVKDIASKITVKKVTEYKSEEQVSNVEQTTFTLSNTVDLTVDRAFKAPTEIGTEMCLDGKTVDRDLKVSREIGTQMSVVGKYVDSPFHRDFKLAKEIATQKNLETITYVSSLDFNSETSREIGTQMSLEGKPFDSTADRDYKAFKDFGIPKTLECKTSVSTLDFNSETSREIGTQMSLEGTKDIQENDSNKLSKENAREIYKQSNITGTVTEKSEKEYSNLSTQARDGDIEGVTILKGNVSRLKNKITKETMVISKKEIDEDLPKKKTVLSKIEIFERLEPKEPYPVIDIPTRNIKSKYVPLTVNRTNSVDRPKIVDELLKEQSQFDSLEDTNKVEIGVKYDAVTYTSQPVKTYWKTEDGYGRNVSEVNRVITETNTLKTEDANWETAKILPEILDYTSNESQIEFAKTLSDEAQIQRDNKQIEIPTIFPNKTNEAEIGKVKPGKINLNNWTNQVEINKSSVDKINVLKKESLHEIAKTLPGKVDFKTNESQVPVSKYLLGKIDYKKDENQIQITTTLPAKIEFESEPTKILPEIIDYKTDDSQSGVGDNLSSITQGYLVDDVTPLPERIDFKLYEIQTRTATTLPGKIDIEVNSLQTEVANAAVAQILLGIKDESKSEINQKEVGSKPKPGKINFNLWANQVETNKTLVGKSVQIKKSKEVEIAKVFPGKADFKAYDKQVKVSETLQGNNEINRGKYKFEIAKTSDGQIDLSPTKSQVEVASILPGKIDFVFTENQAETAKPGLDIIDFSRNETQVAAIKTLSETVSFSSASSQIEEAITLPGRIEFNTLENQVEEPKILRSKIDFEPEFVTNESKAEIAETLQDNIYFSSTENQTEIITSHAGKNTVKKVGKINLNAWENQVKFNKTLVDKIDVVRSENLEEIAKTLPGKINFTTHQRQVKEAKTFQETIDFNTEESKVQSTTSNVEIDADRYEKEVATILPGKIEFDPFKHTPRLNNFPMIIPLNTLENRILGNDDNKVEIPVESDPRESLSDPELVDEDSEVEIKQNKDSIIGSVKKKLYLITNQNSVQDSTNLNTPTNTPMVAEDLEASDITDNYYERKVEELLTKTYSIKDIGQKMVETENYTYSVPDYSKNNSVNEYEFSCNTNTVQNGSELNSYTPTVENEPTKNAHGADDFITSAEDFKTPIYLLDDIENNIPTTKNVTNENVFHFDIAKVKNELTRSAYGADDFITSTEELKRTKSLAELDLGDVINGQVRRIVGKIKSVDFSRRESVKTEISIKEMPKKMSVLEKIALFEGKSSPSKFNSATIKKTVTKKSINPVFSEEVYLKKIEELNTGKIKFGRMEDMLYLPLADGAEIPVLAVGTALVDPRLLPHVIGAAIDMGYRAIDTGYIYGNEREIGQAIKAKIEDGTVKREDLYIISKLWSTFHRTDLVEVACRASLENMGLDYFDLYLIHNPMSFKEGSDPVPKIATVLQYSQYDYLDAWYGMEDLVSKGLVKSIGVSNFNSQQIQRILDKGKLKPVINQVECHPYLTQQRLHAFCAERNITLSCFGVLGSKGTPAEYKNSMTPVIDDALVQVMASGLGVTPAQLLIRYQIECGHNVVVKASSAAHLWDNLQALTFTLDQPQVDALHALNKNKRTFTFKGMGDTHKNYPFLAPY